MPTDRAKLSKLDININGIFFKMKGTWIPDECQQLAAWEIYLEMMTRISTVSYKDGSIRESLTSLHTLFTSMRSTLKKHGPGVARRNYGSTFTLADFVVHIMNDILRPFLGKWHIRLKTHESKRSLNKSILDHEQDWEYRNEFEKELENLQNDMNKVSSVLAEAAHVSPIGLIEENGSFDEQKTEKLPPTHQAPWVVLLTIFSVFLVVLLLILFK